MGQIYNYIECSISNNFKIVLLSILNILIAGCQTTTGGQSAWVFGYSTSSDYSVCKTQVCANNDWGGHFLFGPAILLLVISIGMHARRASVIDQISI